MSRAFLEPGTAIRRSIPFQNGRCIEGSVLVSPTATVRAYSARNGVDSINVLRFCFINLDTNTIKDKIIINLYPSNLSLRHFNSDSGKRELGSINRRRLCEAGRDLEPGFLSEARLSSQRKVPIGNRRKAGGPAVRKIARPSVEHRWSTRARRDRRPGSETECRAADR